MSACTICIIANLLTGCQSASSSPAGDPDTAVARKISAWRGEDDQIRKTNSGPIPDIPLQKDTGENPSYLVKKYENISDDLTIQTKLFKAVLANSEEEVKKLIAEGADPSAMLKDNSSIHIASALGQDRILAELLRDGRSGNSVLPKTGETPLMVAVWNLQPGSVKILLNKGVKVNQLSVEGRTALDFCEEMIKLLSKKPDKLEVINDIHKQLKQFGGKLGPGSVR